MLLQEATTTLPSQTTNHLIGRNKDLLTGCHKLLRSSALNNRSRTTSKYVCATILDLRCEKCIELLEYLESVEDVE
jgi:hypothetical protein